MPIAFDNIVFALQGAGGISRFWSRVIVPYAQQPDAQFIEGPGCSANIYRREMALRRIVQDHRLPRRLARYLNFRRRFFEAPYVFHSSYYRVNIAPGVVNVTTVHDLIYEKFGSGFGTALHARQKIAALRRSDCVVCVSQHTRRDLLKHYAFCAKKRVEVIPNGVDQIEVTRGDPTDVLQRAGVPGDPYCLYVGHRGSCKGFDRVHVLLDALPAPFRCVVVGAPFTPREVAEIRARRHSDRIVNVGKVSESVLHAVYANARFFFFPSLYEGFGIPPLEAMQSGCPVLASNRSSVPEVVGDAALLFDPDDSAALALAAREILRDDVGRRLSELGRRRAAQFGWEPVVSAYAALYAELLRGAPASVPGAV